MDVLAKMLILAGAALCLGNAPPVPLIEGSFDGVMRATRAARACGLKQMRVQVHVEITMMWDEGGPTYGGTAANMACLARWATRNERKRSITWVPATLRRR